MLSTLKNKSLATRLRLMQSGEKEEEDSDEGEALGSEEGGAADEFMDQEEGVSGWVAVTFQFST